MRSRLARHFSNWLHAATERWPGLRCQRAGAGPVQPPPPFTFGKHDIFDPGRGENPVQAVVGWPQSLPATGVGATGRTRQPPLFFSYAGKTLPKGVFLRIPDLGTVTPATDLLVANCSFLTALSRANTKSSLQSFYPPVDRRLKQRAGWLRRPTALGPRAARIAWRSFRGAAPYADGDVRRRTRCYRVARSTAGPPS
jgi:hypothetical protein